MKYNFSEYWTKKARGVALELFPHIPVDRIACIESLGSKTRRTVARIHTIPKVMQLGMQEQPFYTIELIMERFGKQNNNNKLKTIIHELMHIPKGFKGGFRHHGNYVTPKKVETQFQKYLKLTNSD